MGLHEALMTRGDVQGNDNFVYPMKVKTPEDAKHAMRVSHFIFHPCNCVLVHANCHKPGKGGDRIFEACAKQIVNYEGWHPVHDFLDAMQVHYPEVASDALRRFEGLELR